MIKAPQKNRVVYTATKVDRDKMVIYAISIACRAIIIYFLNKIGSTEGAGWQRTLVFLYVFSQIGALIYFDRQDKKKESAKVGDTGEETVINLNTVRWWKSWQHVLLLVAVGFVNFDNEYFWAWLAGDLLVSVTLYTYYRVIKVRRFLRRQNYTVDL